MPDEALRRHAGKEHLVRIEVVDAQRVGTQGEGEARQRDEDRAARRRIGTLTRGELQTRWPLKPHW